ncbi:hypothetical protein AGIG_G8603 [Arapaima gigas]
MANKCVADEQLMKPKSLEGLSAAGSINETSQSHFGSPGSGMLHLSCGLNSYMAKEITSGECFSLPET